MEIGRRIRELREQRGWSQEQLAMQARRHIGHDGASKNARLAAETISRIENGHRKPDPWVQQALATALGVSVGYLVAGESPVLAEGAPVLPAEVAGLAERLAGLPDAVRARLLPVLAGLVALFSADGLDVLSGTGAGRVAAMTCIIGAVHCAAVHSCTAAQ